MNTLENLYENMQRESVPFKVAVMKGKDDEVPFILRVYEFPGLDEAMRFVEDYLEKPHSITGTDIGNHIASESLKDREIYGEVESLDVFNDAEGERKAVVFKA